MQATGPGAGDHLGSLPASRARTLGQRPFVTFTDGVTGERTELGFATFENWVAKTANLLVEELELRPGEVLATDLGTHWTALVIIAAAWRAGLVVALPTAEAAPSAAAVREGAGAPAIRHLVVGAGLGARMRGDPGEGIPFAEEVLAFADDFDDHPGAADEPVLAVGAERRTSADLLAGAARLRQRARLEEGARYASTLPVDTEAGLLAGPVLALAAGSGLVLVHATPADRLPALVAGERCAALLAPPGEAGGPAGRPDGQPDGQPGGPPGGELGIPVVEVG